MISLKISTIFTYLCLSIHHTNAIQCSLNGTTCTFSGVRTTESKPFFYPHSQNNSVVEKIEFRNSTIHILTEEICVTFPNIREMRITNVSLTRIAPKALFKCEKLTFLNFWNNKLVTLDTDLFNQNQELTKIFFQNNRLKAVNGNVFNNLTQLSVLSFSENLLTDFDVRQFPLLEKLSHLYLHTNDLLDLDEQELVEKFPNLKEIFIHNNLFDCDRLKIIIDVLSKHEVKFREWYQQQATRNYNLSTVDDIECLTKDEKITRIINSKLVHVVDLRKQLGIEGLEDDGRHHTNLISRLTDKQNFLEGKVLYLVTLNGLLLVLVLVIMVVFVLKFFKIDRPINWNGGREENHYYESVNGIPYSPLKSGRKEERRVNIYDQPDEPIYLTPLPPLDTLPSLPLKNSYN